MAVPVESVSKDSPKPGAEHHPKLLILFYTGGKMYKTGDRVLVLYDGVGCKNHSATVVKCIGYDDFNVILKCDCGKGLSFGKSSSLKPLNSNDPTTIELDMAITRWEEFFNVRLDSKRHSL